MDGIPFEMPVIPAKAGIQAVVTTLPKVCGADSRFRGNDCDSQDPCHANEASTLGPQLSTVDCELYFNSPRGWRQAERGREIDET